MSNLTLQEQLEGYKRIAFVEENAETNKNNDNSITKIEIKVETQDYKDSNNIYKNKIYNKSIHSNLEKEVAVNRINKNIQIKRGEIWMVDLGNNGDSIQSFRHPFLVTSNDLNNQHSPNITGCSGTSKMKARLPVHVEVEQGCGGLKVRTTILCETLRPIDRSKFLYKMGEVDDNIMLKVKKAINIQNGDIKPKNTLEKLPLELKNYILNKIKFIEKAKESIDFYKSIKADEYSINLAEDEKFREENALQSYCDYNRIDFNEIYSNYFDLIERKDQLIAI